MVEDDLQWKTTFSGRQPLLDPCMLPTQLCGIFFIQTYIKTNTGGFIKLARTTKTYKINEIKPRKIGL